VTIFAFDILLRSIAEVGYFFRFYFFVDIAACLIIVYSSFADNVSIFIVLSFSKVIMIVRMTDIVMAYKQWSRKRLISKVTELRKKLHRRDKKKRGYAMNRNANLDTILSK